MLQKKRLSMVTYTVPAAITIDCTNYKLTTQNKKSPANVLQGFLIHVKRLYIQANIAPPINASTSP
jgi:hypothetical protein